MKKYIIYFLYKNINYLLILILLFLSYSFEFTGKVIKIIDGDTLYILSKKNKKIYKIRLADIDAPEYKQKFGIKSRNFIYSKIFGKNIIIKKQKNKDKYGRIVGYVFYKNKNIGEELLKQGFAWVWHFSKNNLYYKYQNHAKKNKIGLWSIKEHIDPFIWRKYYNK